MKAVLYSLLTILLSVSPAWAVVSAGTTTTFSQAASTSHSFSHSCTGNLLILDIGINGMQTLSAVTFNGVALTQKRRQENSTVVASEHWYLVSPTQGSNTIAYTTSGSTITAAGATCFTGVDTGTPFGTDAVTADPLVDSPTLNVTGVTDGLVYDSVYGNGTSSSFTIGAGQTSLYNFTDAADVINLGGSTETTVGTATMSWTEVGDMYINQWAVPILPAAAELFTDGQVF